MRHIDLFSFIMAASVVKSLKRDNVCITKELSDSMCGIFVCSCNKFSLPWFYLAKTSTLYNCLFITGLWRAGPLPSDIVIRWDLEFVRKHVNCYCVICFFSNDHEINVKILYRDTGRHIYPKRREMDWQSLKIKILTLLSVHTSAVT